EARHDVTDNDAAYALASLDFPGKFGVFYEVDRPTKNQLEQKWIDGSREKVKNASAKSLIGDRFASMR
ncbi:MAG: pyruvate ferredoxin oxidoreductase, partial [Verrucomicrobiae bacterium]|nr:pyruvate ferredoxin oxidoreductase [Verrucomicrobiae bacterium]